MKSNPALEIIVVDGVAYGFDALKNEIRPLRDEEIPAPPPKWETMVDGMTRAAL